MDVKQWRESLHAAEATCRERLAQAEKRLAGSESTAYSTDRTVRVTVDGRCRVTDLAIKPTSLRDHSTETLAHAVMEAHRTAAARCRENRHAIRETIQKGHRLS